MRRITIAAAALALALAPVAQADSDSDYLNIRDKTYGLNANESPKISKNWLTLGHAICDDLRAGTSAQIEANAINRIMPKLDAKESGEVVTAEQVKLCADTTRA